MIRITALVTAVMLYVAPAMAQDLTEEVYLDLGRCEGFYTEYLAALPPGESRTAYEQRLKNLRAHLATLSMPDAKKAYDEAAETGRRALQASLQLGAEHLAAFVDRRTRHCEALLTGLTAR